MVVVVLVIPRHTHLNSNNDNVMVNIDDSTDVIDAQLTIH